MIKKNFPLGLFLILVGIIFLFLNLNILNFHWLLFILSIGLIIIYIYKQYIIYLIGGLVLLSISSVSLIDQYIFTSINIKPFIYLLVLGSGLNYFYYKSREKVFIIVGNFILALSLNSLINQLAVTDIPWFKFILFALGFYIAYLIAYKNNGIIWPRNISYLMLAIGIIYLLSVQKLFNLSFLKISYILPMIIILMGIRIVYTAIREKR